MSASPPEAGGDRPKPPSRRIADELRRAIEASELAPGDRLPSERELARTHGAARNTARQAIQFLLAEGLVEAQHGRGVFVRPPRSLVRLGHDRYARRYRQAGLAPFRAEAERQGFMPKVQVAAIEVGPAPPQVADRLKLAQGEVVVCRRNHYFADDRLVQLVDTCIPARVAGDGVLRQPEVGVGGIYQRLEELGHRLAAFREDVTARMPRPGEVQALGIPPGVPVLEVWHTSLDQDGKPFEVTHFILPADRNELSFELAAG